MNLQFVEKFTKRYQMQIMPKEIKAQSNINTDIVITDGILKFHKNDARETVRNRYTRSLQNYETGKITKNN